jgi:hypothetical protein
MGAYSKLHNATYQEVKKLFPHYRIRENVRPDWLMSSNLTKLELDIFISEINLAIEIQGEQHYEFNSFFHKTYDDFLAQKQRDQEKRDLCYGKGIKLVEIACFIDLSIFVDRLKELPETQRNKKVYSRKSLMRSKSFRIRRRARRRRWRLRQAGLLPPYVENPLRNKKLPGSQRQRHNAKAKLLCEQLDENTWKIWGGENEHIVKNWQCDCWQAVNRGICTHVIKIIMTTESYAIPGVN